MRILIAGSIYILGALTCLSCTVMLGRGYKRTRIRMLMWSGVFFAGLTVENVLLFFDLSVFPELDLTLWRHSATLLGLASLFLGFVWEGE